jgi:hypothetical protein
LADFVRPCSPISCNMDLLSCRIVCMIFTIIYNKYHKTIIEQVVRTSGSHKWFAQVVRASGSRKWFAQVVSTSGSRKWFAQVVSTSGSRTSGRTSGLCIIGYTIILIFSNIGGRSPQKKIL